jgi:hypothetical protein
MFLLFRHILLGALIGVLVMALLTQIPSQHRIDIGGYDAAYVQGFLEPEAPDSPFLVGSDGSARWTGASSALLLPQIGLPAEFVVRLRGHAPSSKVAIYLNGNELLGEFLVDEGWSEQRVTINGGLLKPIDLFIELRSTPSELPDGRSVGVLLDQANYRNAAWPILPFPAQLVYGALIGGLLVSAGGARTAPTAAGGARTAAAGGARTASTAAGGW